MRPDMQLTVCHAVFSMACKQCKSRVQEVDGHVIVLNIHWQSEHIQDSAQHITAHKVSCCSQCGFPYYAVLEFATEGDAESIRERLQYDLRSGVSRTVVHMH